ncbi:DNA-3-methyladenine glycosylase [Bifidobacterium dolichotidis]|uniref:DNA-3-methyladenine glycosylase n=1 Tax=Bifidobacterium dolichotidis TaxID=2306976 RepID=A0A430FSQ0_9BIFI|nr:DNA-3-methyladenine glycosylase I [Bifidobacterium dolichotidis]RSX55889.1 DNA-3-methyladenine glycosylase [Bifidobacterium dolichotidis]
MQTHNKRIQRCSWVQLDDPLMVAYHDTEWCKPHHDAHYEFEMLILEMFQAGLSWQTILRKREAFQDAFADFDVNEVVQFTDAEIDRLMQNTAIIRNRRKITAGIINAHVVQQIESEPGGFDHYLWSFTNDKVVHQPWQLAQSALSERVSKDMRKRGMKFVGPVIVQSFLQAVGIINAHEKGCIFSFDMP